MFPSSLVSAFDPGHDHTTDIAIYPTAPGVRRQTHAVRRSQRRDAPDLRHAAGAGDIRLCDIEGTALKQILEVEPRELALA
jgi:hypothetical protein